MELKFRLSQWDRNLITESLLSSDYNLKTIRWFLSKEIDRELVWILASRNQLFSTLRRGVGENLPNEIRRITSSAYSKYYLFHLLSIIEKIALDVFTICYNHPYQKNMGCSHFTLALEIALQGIKEAKAIVNKCLDDNEFSLSANNKVFDLHSTYLYQMPQYRRFAQATELNLSQYKFIHIWQADLSWAKKICGYQNTKDYVQEERIKKLNLGIARTEGLAVLKEYLGWLVEITKTDDRYLNARKRWKSDIECMWLPF